MPGDSPVQDDPAPDGEPQDAPEGETPMLDPAVAPLRVWQYARTADRRVMLDLIVERNAAVAAPNGIVLAQSIPAAWEIESSNPPIQTFNQQRRVAKWLFTDSNVAEGHVVLVLTPAEGNPGATWTGAGAWYTFRKADGTSGRVAAGTHPDSPPSP